MAEKGKFEEAVLMGELLGEGLFEDSCFYYEENGENQKFKEAPLMNQKDFLEFKNRLFCYQETLKKALWEERQSGFLEEQ